MERKGNDFFVLKKKEKKKLENVTTSLSNRFLVTVILFAVEEKNKLRRNYNIYRKNSIQKLKSIHHLPVSIKSLQTEIHF